MVLLTNEEMHVINNKLTIIIGNIDINDIADGKGTLKNSVVKASKDLKKIIVEILNRNIQIQNLLKPDIE